MDNQQERWNSWLGGIIDGEGCITMVASNAKRRSRTKLDMWVRYTPIVTVVNRNQKILDKVVEIFKKNNIAYYVWESKFRRSTCTTIRIHGVKRVLRVLNFIAPYLVGKKEVAEYMIEYCTERLRLGNKPQNDKTINLAKQIRKTNCVTSSKSSETIRQPRYWREDIVQPFVKA